MNESDYEEIFGRSCARCKGWYSSKLESHPLDECDFEIARNIMES
jgi:hypothetical protein